MSREENTSRSPVAFSLLIVLLIVALALVSCDGNVATPAPAVAPDAIEDEEATLILPELEPTESDDRLLHVVATTDVIGDVVEQVGGDQISLVTLMATGQDPHSYEPSTGDLAAVADANVIFVNGWGLEESVLNTIERTAEHGPLVPISAGVTPLRMGEGEGQPGSVDPHVWLDPHNVIQWTENVAASLGALNPANAETYSANADAYGAQLEDLIDFIEAQTMQIPADKRKLVVTHDSLNYFAQRFGYDVVGAVITGSSTLAEPSAGELADLIAVMEEAGVCTVFVESTVNRSLAETVAGELATCDDVQIGELFTGSLGPEGSPAGSYIGMMRTNMDAIVGALGS